MKWERGKRIEGYNGTGLYYVHAEKDGRKFTGIGLYLGGKLENVEGVQEKKEEK